MSKGTGFEYLEGTPIADPGNDPTPAATPRTRLWPDSGAAGGLRYRPSASAAGRPIQAPTFPAIVPVVANTTALDGQCVFYNPTSTFTIKAPANPSIGSMFWIKNVTTSATAITVDGNGKNLEDPQAPGVFAASFTTGVAGQILTWIYDGTEWALFTSTPIALAYPTSRWAAPGAPIGGNGSPSFPYTTVAQFIAAIPAQTQPRQEDTWNCFLVEKNLSGSFSENVTVPGRTNVAFVGESGFEFIHGNMTWASDYATINGDSFLCIEDVALSGNLTVSDTNGGAGTTGITFVQISMSRFNSQTSDGNIQGNFDASAATRFGSLSLIGGVIVGNVNCPNGTIYATDAHMGPITACNQLRAKSTNFSGNIVVNDAGGLTLLGCTFSGATPTITKTAGASQTNVIMDSSTYGAFLAQGGTIGAGVTLIRRWGGLRQSAQTALAADIAYPAGTLDQVALSASMNTSGASKLKIHSKVAGATTTAAGQLRPAFCKIFVDGVLLAGSGEYMNLQSDPSIAATFAKSLYSTVVETAILAAGAHTVELHIQPDPPAGLGDFACAAATQATSQHARLILEEVTS